MRKFVILAVVGVFAACTDAPSEPPTESDPSFLVASAPRQVSAQHYDARASDLAEALTGFGGMFYDQSGKLNVYVKGGTSVADVRSQIRNFIVSDAIIGSDPSYLDDIDRDVSGLTVRPGQYDFRELHEWMLEIVAATGGMSEIAQWDVDESQNRISVGVWKGFSPGPVRQAILEIGVPAAAFFVKEVAGADEMCPPMGCEDPPGGGGGSGNLQDQVRPVPGGVQVFRAPATGCTLGFNFKATFAGGSPDPQRYFTTAAHCTSNFGVVNSDVFHQHLSPFRIGAEVADPALFTSATDPACPATRVCRYSDVALFQYDFANDADQGMVAWPDVLNNIVNPPLQSLDFSQTKEVIAQSPAYQGLTVYKIGRTTGRTVGNVVNGTCVAVNVPGTNRTLLCQNQTTYVSSAGDSGGPVVSLTSGSKLVARGVHRGGVPDFSDIFEVVRELQAVMNRTLSVSQ